MKRESKLGYLGFLGFLGLLGLTYHNPGLYGFYGFFGFFGLLWGKNLSDERLRRNHERAAKNGFIVLVGGLLAVIAATGFSEAAVQNPLTTVIAVLFSLGILVYSLSLVFYNRRGD